MPRLLAFALCLCLCLAVAPAALAVGDDPAEDDDPACAATVTEDDGCDTDAGEDGADEDGETGKPQGEQPSGGRCGPGEDDGAAGDGGGDAPAGEDEEAEPDLEGDELGEPSAEAETALPAPGFRDFCEAPVFDRAFLRRTWRVRGGSSGFAGDVLAVAVASIPRTPARFREQAGRLVGLELAVVVHRRTRLSRTRTPRGTRRRGGQRVTLRRLRRARRVEVQGKLLPPARWRRDADGLRVPTLRAARITVVR